MPCGKLRPWEEYLNNLKLIDEKMPLKISSFLKNDSLIDYLIRTDHTTELVHDGVICTIMTSQM